MPTDNLYWNPVDFSSDESTTNTIPRNYVDPWDLENYAYIRQHLDSLELSPDPSSAGEPQEAASTFSYIPANDPYPSDPLKYDSFVSENGTAKYAEIAEEEFRNDKIVEIAERRRKGNYTGDYDRGGAKRPKDTYFDAELDELPYDGGHPDTSFYVYQSGTEMELPIRKKSKSRRYSYAFGDDGYNTTFDRERNLYSRLDDSNPTSDYNKNVPIYDDVRIIPSKPTHFGLSNYGHLKIDYSFSWNNLDKYIYK